jgi:glycosyltransferase involved in cell wall biosynthesis
MRILFFTHYFFPEGNAPASRVYENCKRFVAAGHKVTVITGAPNVPTGVLYQGYKNSLYQRESIDGIDVVRVWTLIAANRGKIKRSLNYLSYMFTATIAGLCAKRPDIIIATSPQFFCGWAGVLVSRFRRISFVLEVRDIWPEAFNVVEIIRNALLFRCLEWLEIKMYRAAQHIITVGNGYRQELLKRGVPDEKISIVMNGVDTELFIPQEADATLKRRLGLEGRFVCSYVGTIGLACALDVVIQAAQILRGKKRDDIAFLLVGDGAVRESLESEARRLCLGNIVFTGRQDKARVPAFFSISDVCLVHLKRHDFFTTVTPSKIFEAAGMAKPILIGVPGDAAALVQKANAGVQIEPENAHQLVETLERLAADPSLCQQYGESGRQYVLEHFDRDELAMKYLGIITPIVNPELQATPVTRLATEATENPGSKTP